MAVLASVTGLEKSRVHQSETKTKSGKKRPLEMALRPMLRPRHILKTTRHIQTRKLEEKVEDSGEYC